MAEAKNTKLKAEATRFINKISNNYLVIKNLMALSCFVLAFSLFLSYGFIRGEIVKTLVTLMGVLVIFLILGLIVEFVLKTVSLENNSTVKRFSALLSINLVLGLAIPLFYLNMVLWGVVQLLGQFRYTGTALCEIRVSFINFYYNNGIYFSIGNFIKLVVVTAFFVFVLGALVERYWKR